MTVENISISVRTNADKAATKINALSLALEKLENTAHQAQYANTAVSNTMTQVSSSGRAANSGAKSAARGISDVEKSAKKVQSPLGNFVASLKRIAFYRFLRTVIKEIAQAFKEGLTSLYEFSKANNDFGGVASALDRISSAAAQMKNQLGAALGQLLVQLEPVITALINLITKLAQAITWLVALISGETQYMVADPVTKSWEEAKDAAGAYKNTILGFDEINRLDAPSGGGSNNTGNGGGFHYEDVGSFLPKIDGWIAGFTDKIDGAIGKVGELAAELLWLPQPEVDVEYKDNATVPLNGLVRTVKTSFPLFATIIMAIQGNPIPFIQTVRAAIIEFSKKSVESFGDWQLAYAESCAEIEDESVSLVGSFGELFAQIDELLNNMVDTCEKSVASVSVENATLESDMQKTFAKITETVNTFVENYQTASENIQIENATLSEDVSTTFAAIKQTVNGWMEHFWQKVGEYQQASGAMQIENETLNQDVATTYASIRDSIKNALDNAYTNIYTFTTETWGAFREWGSGVAKRTSEAFTSVATSVYEGLQNGADNVVAFVNSTASSIWSWATNTAQNIASWATNVAQNVGKALSSAWENFKDFMSATGQAISGWWSENKSWAVPVAIGAAVTVGAIALAPFTGGASLGAIALAADGGMFPNDGTLFVAGEQGAEIVTNMGSGRTGVTNVEQMKEAVREGNYDLLSVVQGGINIIVKAINEIDPDITLDGQSLADKMYRYNQQAANRYGMAMVT